MDLSCCLDDSMISNFCCLMSVVAMWITIQGTLLSAYMKNILSVWGKHPILIKVLLNTGCDLNIYILEHCMQFFTYLFSLYSYILDDFEHEFTAFTVFHCFTWWIPDDVLSSGRSLHFTMGQWQKFSWKFPNYLRHRCLSFHPY